MVAKPPLQRSYTYSARSLEGVLSPRLTRCVQRAGKAWGPALSLIELPAELGLPVDFEFLFCRDGSFTLTHGRTTLDFGHVRYALTPLTAWLLRRVELRWLCQWAIGAARLARPQGTPLSSRECTLLRAIPASVCQSLANEISPPDV